MATDVSDNGYSSRKFWLTVGTIGLIFLTGLVANWASGLRSIIEVLIGGYLFGLGTYCGANVGAKWTMSRHGLNMPDQDPVEVSKLSPVQVVTKVRAVAKSAAKAPQSEGQGD